MEIVIKAIAEHWHLSSSHYWHLRLLSAISLGPLIGVMCLALFSKRKWL